jgi:hypothetical protein
MVEPKTPPPTTAGARLIAHLKRFAEEQKPTVVAVAKRADKTAAKGLAVVNDLLRRLQKK